MQGYSTILSEVWLQILNNRKETAPDESWVNVFSHVFLQAGVPFSKENAKFWPIFSGLNNAVLKQN